MVFANCPLHRPETDPRMGAVAERLVLRTAAAAQGHGRALGAKLVTVRVEQHDRALHQVRSVVEGGYLRSFGHDHPPSLVAPVHRSCSDRSILHPSRALPDPSPGGRPEDVPEAFGCAPSATPMPIRKTRSPPRKPPSD